MHRVYCYKHKMHMKVKKISLKRTYVFILIQFIQVTICRFKVEIQNVKLLTTTHGQRQKVTQVTQVTLKNTCLLNHIWPYMSSPIHHMGNELPKFRRCH